MHTNTCRTKIHTHTAQAHSQPSFTHTHIQSRSMFLRACFIHNAFPPPFPFFQFFFSFRSCSCSCFQFSFIWFLRDHSPLSNQWDTLYGYGSCKLYTKKWKLCSQRTQAFYPTHKCLVCEVSVCVADSSMLVRCCIDNSETLKISVVGYSVSLPPIPSLSPQTHSIRSHQ